MEAFSEKSVEGLLNKKETEWSQWRSTAIKIARDLIDWNKEGTSGYCYSVSDARYDFKNDHQLSTLLSWHKADETKWCICHEDPLTISIEILSVDCDQTLKSELESYQFGESGYHMIRNKLGKARETSKKSECVILMERFLRAIPDLYFDRD